MFYFLLSIVLVCFGATRIQINALSGSGKRNRSGSGSGPGSGAKIEVDPNPAKCSGSGSGSETLPITYMIPRSVWSDSFLQIQFYILFIRFGQQQERVATSTTSNSPWTPLWKAGETFCLESGSLAWL